MSQTEELIQVGAAEFIVKLAECEEEVYKAMRLRYEVFVEEEDNRFLMNPLRLEQDLTRWRYSVSNGRFL